MATYSHTTLPLLLLFLNITLTLFRSSEAAGIAVYWGQDENEGSLADTCNTGHYKYVNIAYLEILPLGRTPVLFLDHCNPSGGGCTSISDDIKTCQGRGIKVMLSIGGPTLVHHLEREYHAHVVAQYIWNNFLDGSSDSRPLGDAVLDGIDFDIQIGFPKPWFWLVVRLAEKGVYLSAAPECFIVDSYLESAIQIGLFHFVWMKFYNHPGCEYDGGNVDNLLAIWNKWASRTHGQLFMGLPADPAAAVTGYIYPDMLNLKVLPKIKASKNYGGVMLWNRFYDLRNYSSEILPNL